MEDDFSTDATDFSTADDYSGDDMLSNDSTASAADGVDDMNPFDDSTGDSSAPTSTVTTPTGTATVVNAPTSTSKTTTPTGTTPAGNTTWSSFLTTTIPGVLGGSAATLAQQQLATLTKTATAPNTAAAPPAAVVQKATSNMILIVGAIIGAVLFLPKLIGGRR